MAAVDRGSCETMLLKVLLWLAALTIST